MDGPWPMCSSKEPGRCLGCSFPIQMYSLDSSSLATVQQTSWSMNQKEYIWFGSKREKCYMAAFHTVSEWRAGHWTDKEGNSLTEGRRERKRCILWWISNTVHKLNANLNLLCHVTVITSHTKIQYCFALRIPSIRNGIWYDEKL